MFRRYYFYLDISQNDIDNNNTIRHLIEIKIDQIDKIDKIRRNLKDIPVVCLLSYPTLSHHIPAFFGTYTTSISTHLTFFHL